MKCSICSLPIVLVPSAAERAAKYGGKPSDYSALFTTHADCALRKRAEDTRALIERNRTNPALQALRRACSRGTPIVEIPA